MPTGKADSGGSGQVDGPSRLQTRRQSIQTTDAEGFVKSFTKSPLVKKLRRVFDTFDIDGNGKISLDEISTMVQTLRIDFSEERIIEMMRSADTDGDGEVDFDEFREATSETDFDELVTTASFPAEIYKILEEGNTRFLETFLEYVVEVFDECQREVLAAKVPLASFGRVHSALTEAKSQLSGGAQELLEVEFAQLRSGALESLKAQREAIEGRHEALIQARLQPIVAEAESRVAEAGRRQAEVAAEAERLQSRYSKPEALIAKLEAELSKATEQVATLQARVTAFEEDWHTAYPQALAASTLPPPPLPVDTPYIVRALEGRGMSLDHFFGGLDPEGSGLIGRVELRRTMQQLGMLPTDNAQVSAASPRVPAPPPSSPYPRQPRFPPRHPAGPPTPPVSYHPHARVCRPAARQVRRSRFSLARRIRRRRSPASKWQSSVRFSSNGEDRRVPGLGRLRTQSNVPR